MYNYIDEYKDYLQDTGTCVIDNFIGMYGGHDHVMTLSHELKSRDLKPLRLGSIYTSHQQI